MSKICPCPHPPGGHIVCEDNQFGMCAYKDGEKVGGCLNIPGAIMSIEDRQEGNLATTNWVLSELTVIQRDQYEQIYADVLEILRSGQYTNRQGHVVRFSLPEGINLDSVPGVGMAGAN